MVREATIQQFRLLVKDVEGAILNWRLWLQLGWNDIAKEYRRSFIGPVWITLSTAIFIVGFGFIGAQIFGRPLQEFLPYFCTGVILYQFLSHIVTESCSVYTGASAYLKLAPYPRFAFCLKLVWKNVITLAHNLVVVLAVLIWSGHLSNVRWLELLAAVLLTLLTAPFVVAIIGAIATRFRDVAKMISSVMQLGFFVTPIMFHPEQLSERAQMMVVLNPFASFLDIMRQPLLGSSGSALQWNIAFGLLLAAALLFMLLYTYVRRRIVYWL